LMNHHFIPIPLGLKSILKSNKLNMRKQILLAVMLLGFCLTASCEILLFDL
jgi:hypothetical protein